MVTIELPDGSEKKFDSPVTGMQVAESIGAGLAKAALAIIVNDNLQDLSTIIEKDAKVRILTFKDEEGKHVFWHSCVHMMAQAIMRLFPEAKITIGPTWESGFFYDIDHRPFSEEDLANIEAEMAKIRDEDLQIVREEISADEAKERFKSNPYKLEIIDENVDGAVRVYTQGEFSDPCRGPHVPSTGVLKAFKLTKTSGAYWRGDAAKQQLQRVYGISFPSDKELVQHLAMLEEAEKRDHRKLGPELKLFAHTELSPGAPIFLPKGTAIFNELLAFLRAEYARRGYQEVITPLLYEKSLWETSGHWEHYQDNMFMTEIEGKTYSVKPMNCPSHLLIYKSESRSYRDLPLRIADFAPLHRNELSGTLTGLTRVRKFQQDDAHHFVTPEQIGDEIAGLIDFMQYIYRDVFSFEYTVELSTKPADALGSEQLWQMAEAGLQQALEDKGIPFTINPGDGAFYGPKIDFHIKDSLGRKWQCGTIQLDFNLPKRFGATYEGNDGRKHDVVMIHRALLGSLERFIGVLIEHYAGRFPLWLSPEQVRLVPVSDKFSEYAKQVAAQYRDAGIRATVDEDSETVSKKVRNAQLAQVNYILVVGERESSDGSVTIRSREGAIVGEMKAGAFLSELKSQIAAKK